jgi:hypothetical protein
LHSSTSVTLALSPALWNWWYVVPQAPLHVPVMRQPSCDLLGVAGSSVSAFGSYVTTKSNPLNASLPPVTSTNRSNS